MKQFNCNYCQKQITRSPTDIAKNKTGKFYCSSSCAAKVNNSTSQKRTKTKTCKVCKSLVDTTNHTYCNKCYIEKHFISHKTLADATGNRKDSNRYTGIRGNGRLVYRDSGQPQCCKYCGYSKHVEICHIKDIANFPPDTLISEINDIANLVALCRNHHWELDHKLLTINEILMGQVGIEPTISSVMSRVLYR